MTSTIPTLKGPEPGGMPRSVSLVGGFRRDIDGSLSYNNLNTEVIQEIMLDFVDEQGCQDLMRKT